MGRITCQSSQLTPCLRKHRGIAVFNCLVTFVKLAAASCFEIIKTKDAIHRPLNFSTGIGRRNRKRFLLSVVRQTTQIREPARESRIFEPSREMEIGLKNRELREIGSIKNNSKTKPRETTFGSKIGSFEKSSIREIISGFHCKLISGKNVCQPARYKLSIFFSSSQLKYLHLSVYEELSKS